MCINLYHNVIIIYNILCGYLNMKNDRIHSYKGEAAGSEMLQPCYPLISQQVRLGSLVLGDEWSLYNQLSATTGYTYLNIPEPVVVAIDHITHIRAWCNNKIHAESIFDYTCTTEILQKMSFSSH